MPVYWPRIVTRNTAPDLAAALLEGVGACVRPANSGSPAASGRPPGDAMRPLPYRPRAEPPGYVAPILQPVITIGRGLAARAVSGGASALGRAGTEPSAVEQALAKPD